jgi:hypothetical protein
MASGLIWRLLDDNAVIVTPKSGEVRVFNEVGALVWQMLVDEVSLNEIKEKVVAEYDVSETQAVTDINLFLDKLRHLGLIV